MNTWRTHKEAGHVLVSTLVVAAVLGLAAVAYLNLISSQSNFTVRSQSWNGCIPVIEAGIEEAMAHLNNPLNTNESWGTRGWTYNSTAKTFTKKRGTTDGYYVAVISTNTFPPSITCTGYLSRINAAGAIAVGSGNTAATNYVSRVVRCTTRREVALTKAMVAKMDIDMNGNNITVDSYDSCLGPYNALLARDKGDVATNGDFANAANLGNANIKGHVSVGPHATVKIGPNGAIGSVSWHVTGKKGIEPGWVRKDMNVSLPDVPVPWTGGAFTPNPQGSYKYALDDGNYELSGNLNLASGEQMFVKGKATLWVKGNVNIDQGHVKMNNPGSLRLYISGTATFSGTWDKSIDPKDVLIFGLPSCTAISVKTGASLEAVIYAPSAVLTLVGNANFFGASVSKSVSMNGGTAYHYDECLSKIDVFRGFVITGWQEL